MPDAIPQLRTRLSRLEHAVGLFVLLAALLLISGFGYYVYHTAKRKGWFDTKVTYYTLTYSAAGLNVGDPVKLMGFDVGEITRITGQPPDDLFNVYVEFVVRAPYFAYLWTEGSRARVMPSDLFGRRHIEVTKGSNHRPTHLTWPVQEYPPEEAVGLVELDDRLFLDHLPGVGTNPPVTSVLEPVSREALTNLVAANVRTVRMVDHGTQLPYVTAIWSFHSNVYELDTEDPEPYWLPPDESPSLTKRFQQILEETDRLSQRVLANTVLATSNTVTFTSSANSVLQQSRALLSNLTLITANLTNASGAMGEWLLPPEVHARLLTTLVNADGTLTNATTTLTNASAMLTAANRNVANLVDELQLPLENLSTIISNLNLQVQANTNFVGVVSELLTHTDELISGLQRHWLFRSAFKERKGQPVSAIKTGAPTTRAPGEKGATRLLRMPPRSRAKRPE